LRIFDVFLLAFEQQWFDSQSSEGSTVAREGGEGEIVLREEMCAQRQYVSAVHNL
jgi:hypothetical protein